MESAAFQQCISPDCGARYDVREPLFACRNCRSLLDVAYDWSRCEVPQSLSFFDSRRIDIPTTTLGRLNYSGVWRFRELLPFADPNDIVTLGEGRTLLQDAEQLARQLDHKAGRLFLQYEGFNPSGSFKDNGMAAAMTMAKSLGKRRVACASTGNTSASMALFAASVRVDGAAMRAIVFVGGGKIAGGKLAQALDYGATTLQISGDFDECMRLVQVCADRADMYLMNSINPFRLEGQKAIVYRILEGLGWNVPDWIILPGGNLGNCSAFGKALSELHELGLIQRIPRLAVINAQGADTFHRLVNEHRLQFNQGRINHSQVDDFYADREARGVRAKTVASAIEIARPVNLSKALRSLAATGGVVRGVSDFDILDGKALVGRYGFGCEPASGASIAGFRLLRQEGVIQADERVVCVLTGHPLKDVDITLRYHEGRLPLPSNSDSGPVCESECSNRPQSVHAEESAILEAILQQP